MWNKRNIILLPAIGAWLSVARAQMTSVPDALFEQGLIDLGLDAPPLDGAVPTSNIDTVTELLVLYEPADLTGLEDFTALRSLTYNGGPITTLNISQNTQLEHLYCRSLQLSELDVSNNPLLRTLVCRENNLTELDVSQNPYLEILDVGSTDISALDISQNPLIEQLFVDVTPISVLEVSHLSNLKRLFFANASIAAIDLSQNAALEHIYCGGGQGNPLTGLDLTNNPALVLFYCNGGDAFSSLSLGDKPNLRVFSAINLQIATLDTGDCPNMEEFTCSFSALQELDLSQNPELFTLDCLNSKLECLNLNNGTNEDLVSVVIHGNPLSCVQVDDPDMASDWDMDISADLYATDCGSCAVGNKQLVLEGWKMYPNPTPDGVFLYWNEPLELQITVYDAYGKTHTRTSLSGNGGFLEWNATAGIYFVEARDVNAGRERVERVVRY